MVGTIAMFLVGGGILVYSFAWFHNNVHNLVEFVVHFLGIIAEVTVPTLIEGIVGIVAGGIVLLALTLAKSFKKIS